MQLHGHTYIKRKVEQKLWDLSASFPVVMVTGARQVGKTETFARIIQGGMPQTYEMLPASLTDYFDAYFQTYLSRDIRSLAQVADELSFYKFMQVVAALATEMLEYTDIAKRVGVAVGKIKEWLSVLVSSGLIILLPPYHHNALKRLVKAPKIYFMDTGLLCYLRGMDDAEALMKNVDSGKFFENYVVSEVYKSFAGIGRRPPLSFFRDANNRKEIDLIIERNGNAYPVEIKESSNPDPKACRHFDALLPATPRTGGSVICNSGDIYPLGAGVWALPHWLV